MRLVNLRRWALTVSVVCLLFKITYLEVVCAQESADPKLNAVTEQTDTPTNEDASRVQGSSGDFSNYYDLVYQIRVVSPKAGSKSSIGSGFQVSATGLIVTNYHVVSSYVQSPANHQIQYRAHNGEIGELDLLDFDVINDLAVLRHSNPRERYFRFSDNAPQKGQVVYALGNPRDFGISLVRGPNNGFVEHSYNDQILFSGSLNPGMSGGPALNKNGDVIGVNVATAGSQLSFLVPATKARELVNAARKISPDSYQLEISNQIKYWQRPRIQDLIDRQWSTESFASYPLFGEIRKDFQCWGQTNDDNKERNVDWVSKNCNASNSLFLDSNLNAGHLSFSFSFSRSINLNSVQFSQSLNSAMSADNYSNYENATNYRCHVNFIEGQTEFASGSYNRVTTCIRAYKKLPGLYDSLLIVERNSATQTLNTHLSISAVEQDQIQALNRKFVERSL